LRLVQAFTCQIEILHTGISKKRDEICHPWYQTRRVVSSRVQIISGQQLLAGAFSSLQALCGFFAVFFLELPPKVLQIGAKTELWNCSGSSKSRDGVDAKT
jgi:hypothetical protein